MCAEDQRKDLENAVQKLTDEYVKEVGGVACGVRAGLVPTFGSREGLLLVFWGRLPCGWAARCACERRVAAGWLAAQQQQQRALLSVAGCVQIEGLAKSKSDELTKV